MKFISYAQNFEDVMLWRALKHIEHGFYFDVGAQSPDLDSVTRAFSEAGWSGINIEPHPKYHAQLVERRPRDINLQCALGAQVGSATIHLVGATGLSTLDEGIANTHQDDGYRIQHVEVPVRTLDDVWRELIEPAGQPVHFLKVDVEGFEAQVLQGNTWSVHRPWVVVVEATEPNSQVESYAAWEPQLLQFGYLLVYEDGLNRYYVAEEHGELVGAFRHPPNVFDMFEVAPLAWTRGRVTELEVLIQTQKKKQLEIKESLASVAAKIDSLKDDLARLQMNSDETEDENKTSLTALFASLEAEFTALKSEIENIRNNESM